MFIYICKDKCGGFVRNSPPIKHVPYIYCTEKGRYNFKNYLKSGRS